MPLDTQEVCLDNHRRIEVRARGHNGIDYVDVGDDLRTIIVHLLRRPPEDLTLGNVVIEGQGRAERIKITELQFCFVDDPTNEDSIRLSVERPGNRSGYTLKFVELDENGEATNEPFHGFDPKYSQLPFHFYTDTAIGMDCLQGGNDEAALQPTIDINYLAKDYSTFRQTVLDRLAFIMPGWTEQHTADEGIALIEVLAYVADYLSYYQDAVATEAYLTTARQRISVRRHVRLLDYPMHEGCNSRTWVQLQTGEDVESLWSDPASVLFVSGFEDSPNSGVVLSADDLATAASGSYEAFQPLSSSLPLRVAHNRILFYTWGNHDCYLPAGATGATLEDPYLPEPKEQGSAEAAPRNNLRSLALQVGDYLLLEEVLGPETGVAADADPTHRWVVKLTRVAPTLDPVNAYPIVEIEWDKADALSFALTLATRGPAPYCERIKHVTVACANLFAVDQGTPVKDEALGTVPLGSSTQSCVGERLPSETAVVAGRFCPTLSTAQLAWRTAFDPKAAASAVLIQDPTAALPEITLKSLAPLEDGSGPILSSSEYHNPALLAVRLTQEPFSAATQLLRERLPRKTLSLLAQFVVGKPMDPELSAVLNAQIQKDTRTWTPRRDLLNSAATARDFVVEMDDAQMAHLRFGNGVLGMAPQSGETFFASYRIASGSLGNVGRETIKHVAFLGNTATVGLSPIIDNPIAAAGGVDPEPVGQVKLIAPGAFLNQLDRAITAADYAQLAERNVLVQRAAASLVWTGSRYEVQVAIDPLGTDTPDAELLQQVERYLYPFRRVGHDLRVLQAQYVPLDLALSVTVSSGYLAAHVKRALLDAFGRGRLPDGTNAFFHPDNLTFGQSIYASQIISMAQMQNGVESVTISRFQRLQDEEHDGLVDGVLVIGPLEIAQLDNEAAHPERGRLRLLMKGGR
jgi:hypothetical protein